MTILFVIISGFSIAFSIFAHYMKEENKSQLSKMLDDLYMDTITDNKKLALLEAQNYANLLTLKQENLASLEELYKQIAITNRNISVAIYGKNKEIIYSNLPVVISNSSVFTQKSRENTCWLAGDLGDGIYAYALVPIKQKENVLSGYVLTCVLLSNEVYIKRLHDIYGIDASIFYKETRIVTTVIENDQAAIGTKLSNDIATQLLISESEYLGQSNVLGVPYLAVYKSFGNEEEQPIGIIGIGISMKSYQRAKAGMFIGIILLGLLLLFLARIFSDRWLHKSIILPMIQTTDALVEVAEGNKSFKEHIQKNTQYLEFNHLNDAICKLIEKLQASQIKIEKIAYVDELTQIQNRSSLLKKYEQLTDDLFDNIRFLIHLKLDHLRIINELAGHKEGDRLIIYMGNCLVKTLKELKAYELYRFGGNEFVICCDSSVVAQEVEELVKSILICFNDPRNSNYYALDVPLSIGIAESSEDMHSIEDLLLNAIFATNEAKHQTKSRYLFYNQEMGERIRKRNELEEDLKVAIVNRELFLVYQPKMNVKTGQCDSVEALIRWNHPKRGLVSPLDFIDLAEESGLIILIGKWVLEQACMMNREIQDKYQKPLKIAVNISTLQLNREDFVRMVLEILLFHQIEPQYLELEITESVLIDSLASAVEKLQQLYVLGVGISIDDFGKGYSSLAYLRKLPITTLKIDKLFIDDIEEDEDTLVGDIIELGHHMGLKIIAEGVETEAQLRFLESAECDYIQGYLYGKPMKAEDLYLFLEKEENKNR